MKLNPLVVFGDHILNVNQIRSVYRGPGKKHVIVFNYGHGVLDIHKYDSEMARDANFHRVAAWLHEYSGFFSVVDLVLNFKWVCFIRPSETSISFVLDGAKEPAVVPFETKELAAKAYAELKELTREKKR